MAKSEKSGVQVTAWVCAPIWLWSSGQVHHHKNKGTMVAEKHDYRATLVCDVDQCSVAYVNARQVEIGSLPAEIAYRWSGQRRVPVP